MARGDQLARQWRLWRFLAASGRLHPARELAAQLELSPSAARSIRRDLDALRRAGAPIVRKRQGRDVVYGVLDDGPPPRFDADTLLALRLALGLMRPFERSPIGERLDQLVRDLERRVPERLLSHFRPLADDLIVRPLPGAPRDEGHGPTLDAIRRALAERRTLHLDYESLDGRRSKREVHPQALVWGPRGLYIFALDGSRKQELRRFRVSRIRAAELGSAPARRSINVETTLDGTLGVFSSEHASRTHVLRIRDPLVARLLAEAPWHPSQRLVQEEDGWRLSLQLTTSRELLPRVLALGDAAVVIEPASFRTAVASVLARASAQYKTSRPSARRPGRHRPGEPKARPVRITATEPER